MALEQLRFDEYYVLLSLASASVQGSKTSAKTKAKKKKKSKESSKHTKKSASSATSAVTVLAPRPIKPPPFDRTTQTPVFIFAGQSNMVGRASASDMPPLSEGQKRARLCFSNDLNFPHPSASKSWTSLRAQPSLFDPAHPRDHFGPEISATRVLCESARFRGLRVHAIKFAMGSTSMAEHWHPEGGTHYQDFVEFCLGSLRRLREAGLHPVLQGIFWLQGESDTGKAKTARVYGDSLAAFAETTRTRLGCGDLPFVAAKISWKSKKTKVVNAHIQSLEGRLPNFRCVEAPAHERREDGHLSAEAIVDVGERMAARFIGAHS